MDLRVTYDPRADAAYIYLTTRESACAFRQVELIPGRVVADFDADGCLIGLEVLQASKLLTSEIREAAERLQ